MQLPSVCPRVLLGLVLVASLAVARPAAAQDETEQTDEAARQQVRLKAIGVAQQYVKLGEELFRLGNHAEAVENFRRAEGTLEKVEEDVPAVLYRSMARCYDQLGQIPAALSNYKKFLALAEPSSEQVERAIRDARDAEGRLQTLLDRTSIQFEISPVGAEVRVDGRSVGTAPLKPLQVVPGPHQVTVQADGHESTSVALQIDAGAVVPVVVALEATGTTSTAGPAKGRPSAGSQPPVTLPRAAPLAPAPANPYLLGGLGAWAIGAGITAGALFGAANDREEEGDALAGRTYPTVAEAEHARSAAQDRYDQAAARRTWGWVAAGTGVAALATGVYLLAARGLGPGSAPSLAEVEGRGDTGPAWTLVVWPAGEAWGATVSLGF